MGLRSDTLEGFFILGIGITVAIFQASGTVPDLSERFSKWVNSGSIIVIASLMSLLLSPLIPEDLYILIFLISL